MAMSTATSTLFAAIARPAPIMHEPAYSGCPSQRYGPDDVTSRDLFRWPAAQIRSASPAAATSVPSRSVRPVGCASQRTASAKRNPSGTRSRARRRTKSGTATFCRRETAFDGREHFVDLNVEQAHPLDLALPEVMTLTGRRPRHGFVLGHPRAVPLGPRRPVNADDRRTDGGGDVSGTGVAGNHDCSPASERDDVSD